MGDLNSADLPFDLLHCSWPFPWTPDSNTPLWAAQPTHLRPAPDWCQFGGHDYWTLDWGELFRGGDRYLGTMPGFGVIFQVRIQTAGQFAFTSGGHCEIRRGPEELYRGLPLPDAAVAVAPGDILQIAVAHGPDDWRFGGRIEPTGKAGTDLANVYLPRVLERLLHPDGPPLKVFTDARNPMRTVISIYSMILNGYSPKHVYIYGSYQWKPFVNTLLGKFLPFATPVLFSGIEEQVTRFAPGILTETAKDHWYLMKSCVSLLCEPSVFCMMDDDLFILDSVATPQALAGERDFVFVPERDNSLLYGSIWGSEFDHPSLAATGRVNTALYWLNMQKDRKEVADRMVRGLGKLENKWAWEQGFYAHLFAGDKLHELPAASYWYPFFCGLPGGMAGYDYANNPCGFTMVHFGGDVEKPSDATALQLMPQILGRKLPRGSRP